MELMASGQILIMKIHTFDNAYDVLIKLVTTGNLKNCLD